MEIEEPQIILALICAYIAHCGKVDKAGTPYFEHVLSVYKKMETTDEKIVALLHDVLEDSSITEDNLRNMGFSERIVESVKTLTRCKTQTYKKYLIQVSQNPIATIVKRADVQNNIDPLRLEKLSSKLQKRLRKKYELALLILDNNSA
jgi:(p)ppGpp synthase/HD superfamily hydrolase